jgi:hypothetical protein
MRPELTLMDQSIQKLSLIHLQCDPKDPVIALQATSKLVVVSVSWLLGKALLSSKILPSEVRSKRGSCKVVSSLPEVAQAG